MSRRVKASGRPRTFPPRLVSRGTIAVLLALLPSAGCQSADRWVEPSIGMVFRKIPAGDLLMGSPLDEPGREDQEGQHEVHISRSFWLGAFEVTQREWQLVMGNNPSHFRGGDEKRPVEEVTWFEVRDFLARLSKQSPGHTFRLPTEAEWEYACRAGTTTAYSTGSALHHDQANFAESVADSAAGKGQTTAVGSYPPNAWGLHDMHGNVWEWTQDGGPVKIIRGGSWYYAADSARCALRYTHRPQDRGFSLGFRVARDAE